MALSTADVRAAVPSTRVAASGPGMPSVTARRLGQRVTRNS